MDLFSFVRLVVYGLHCIYLGVRRRHASVSPPTVDLRRKRRRLCESDSRQPGQPVPEKTLGALLEDHEDLMLKVLSCLIDDGLHECRRVSRRWRDLCGLLPVKLSQECQYRLDEAAGLFPGAASLELESSFDSDDVLGRLEMQQSSQLRKLCNLSVYATSTNADMNALTTLLPSADRLRSLDVSVNQKDGLDDIVRALRYFRNLDALIIHVAAFIQTDLAPVTELRGLGYLKTAFPSLFNSHGEFLLPSLTRLTHLHLRSVDQPEPRPSYSLQVSKFR